MPENKQQQPRNIFEAINLNIYGVNENIHTLMQQVAAMHNELIDLRAMFNAPEQPNALGEDGASVVNREQ